MARNNNNKEGGVHVISLSSYNKPEIFEDKKKDWVNYGSDNDYYSYLIKKIQKAPPITLALMVFL